MQGFDSAATKFSPANALWLGRAAELAYKDESEVMATLARWGMRGRFLSAADLLKADTQAFVAADGKALIVAFRGTKDPVDFLTDAEFLQDGFAAAGAVHGKAHVGFIHALDAAWPVVKKTIDEFRDHGQTIWVTGHSLGAALATLAVARLADDGVAVAGLYTFGSPTVGDPAFATSFDAAVKDCVFRYVNDLDIVTRCPPEGVPLLPPYRHVGKRMLFDAKGALTDRVDPLRWLSVATTAAEIAAQARTMSRDQLKLEILAHVKEPLDDHAMAGYVKNLEAALDAPPAPASVLPSLADVLSGFKHLWGK